jgi:hypothetical protein
MSHTTEHAVAQVVFEKIWSDINSFFQNGFVSL